jgi:hypothetical protein
MFNQFMQAASSMGHHPPPPMQPSYHQAPSPFLNFTPEQQMAIMMQMQMMQANPQQYAHLFASPIISQHPASNDAVMNDEGEESPEPAKEDKKGLRKSSRAIVKAKLKTFVEDRRPPKNVLSQRLSAE